MVLVAFFAAETFKSQQEIYFVEVSPPLSMLKMPRFRAFWYFSHLHIQDNLFLICKL